MLADKKILKDKAITNLQEKLSSSLSGPDYDDVRTQIAQYTSLELDSKYLIFKHIDAIIEQIKLNNKEYNESLVNKISPDSPYNEAEIIKLNSVYEEEKNKTKKL